MTATQESYYGVCKVVRDPPSNLILLGSGNYRSCIADNRVGAQTNVYLPDPETVVGLALGSFWCYVQTRAVSLGNTFVYDRLNTLIAALPQNGAAWFSCHGREFPGQWGVLPGVAPISPGEAGITGFSAFSSPINGETVTLGETIPVAIGSAYLVPG